MPKIMVFRTLRVNAALNFSNFFFKNTLQCTSTTLNHPFTWQNFGLSSKTTFSHFLAQNKVCPSIFKKRLRKLLKNFQKKKNFFLFKMFRKHFVGQFPSRCGLFLVPGFSREGPIESVSFVRSFVRSSVRSSRFISETVHGIVLKF